MSTSGTVGQTTIEVSDILDHVMRRCGSTPDKLTPEITEALKNNLFMLLATLSNRGINMWRISRSLLPLYVGQSDYTLTAGTLDIQKALWRVPTRLTGTVSSSSGGTVANIDDGDISTIFTQGGTGNVIWDFGSGNTSTVYLVGVLPSGSQSLNLTFSSSTDGVTYTTVYSVGAASYTDGTWVWYEVNTAKAGRYFKVATSTGTMSMREIYIAQTWYEVDMYRMNRDDFASLPYKKTPSNSPLQFWLDRQRDAPVMVMWPTPSSTFALISLFSHMQIQDVGALSNTVDIPQRWYDALVANLAYNSILEVPGADINRAPLLKEQAMMTMVAAEAEERDQSPSNWTPNLSAYTA